MPTRPFDNSNSTSLAVPRFPRLLEMSSQPVPLLQRSERVDRGASSTIDWPDNPDVEGRALGKGVCWALAIEGAAAIGIYGLWHLWSLIR